MSKKSIIVSVTNVVLQRHIVYKTLLYYRGPSYKQRHSKTQEKATKYIQTVHHADAKKQRIGNN
jgi:hypothetical protein